MRISAQIEGDERLLEVALAVQEGKRTFSLNGKPKQIKSLRGLLPAIAFTPDDLELAKGSNSSRRNELDRLGVQLNANYHQLTSDFERILRQKNSLLKEGATSDMLASVNIVFAKVGEQLTNYRKALAERLAPKVKAHYEAISGGETFQLEYVPSWEGDLLASIESAADKEQARGRALVGPNRDEVAMTIDGRDVTSFASQGQQRSVVLALKLAEAEVVEEVSHQLPIVLLDDVMSELDENRREALVDLLIRGKQTFITTANIDYFDDEMLNRAKIVRF